MIVKKTFGDLVNGDYIYIFCNDTMSSYQIRNIVIKRGKPIVITIEKEFIRIINLPSIVINMTYCETENGEFITPNIFDIKKRLKEVRFEYEKTIDKLNYYINQLDSSIIL